MQFEKSHSSILHLEKSALVKSQFEKFTFTIEDSVKFAPEIAISD